MTDTYVVVAQVGGLTDDNREEKLEALSSLERALPEEPDSKADSHPRLKIKLVSELVRDDGTAELCFDWQPDEEPDGTRSWFEARDSVEHIRSSIQGAALALLNPLTIELRDISSDKPTTATEGGKAARSKSTSAAGSGRAASSS